MTGAARRVTVVLAEDDEDDYLLTKSAFEKASVTNKLHWVKDGVELLDFLRARAADEVRARENPVIVLLDLNMPRMDGREALKEIKADPSLRRIPMIVLTTSKTEEDILKSYDLGVCSYIMKPVDFNDFIEAAKVIKSYWLDLVELPANADAAEPTH